MKKNVRLNSLPSNREVASRDCRTCIKRRIKCDRTVPQCQKCKSRGLDCPGFESVPLRWNQGVASRGKLAGKALPVVLQDEPKNTGEEAEASIARLVNNQDDNFGSQSQAILQHQPVSSDPGLLKELGPFNRFLSTESIEKLLSHFYFEVAPLLTWLDGPQNQWRQAIMPLANRFPTLRLGILGLAVAHLSGLPGNNDDKTDLLDANHTFRDASLRLLNEDMRLELSPNPVTGRENPGGSSLPQILATMLVLCFSEMLTPDSTGWNIHLRACRTIIDRQSLSLPSNEHEDPVAKFLVKEAIDLEAFVNVSSFMKRPSPEVPRPSPLSLDGNSWLFTRLLHEITTVERERHELILGGSQPSLVDMTIWEAKFEDAYVRAHDAYIQTFFEAIIRAHYHAGLIYCYQALALPAESEHTIHANVDLLFHDLQAIGGTQQLLFSHDTFFPLFITGTECRGDLHRQQIVQRLFENTIFTTGVWCNNAALKFLHEFWSSSNDQSARNWIQYAREREIDPFLIF